MNSNWSQCEVSLSVTFEKVLQLTSGEEVGEGVQPFDKHFWRVTVAALLSFPPFNMFCLSLWQNMYQTIAPGCGEEHSYSKVSSLFTQYEQRRIVLHALLFQVLSLILRASGTLRAEHVRTRNVQLPVGNSTWQRVCTLGHLFRQSTVDEEKRDERTQEVKSTWKQLLPFLGAYSGTADAQDDMHMFGHMTGRNNSANRFCKHRNLCHSPCPVRCDTD